MSVACDQRAEPRLAAGVKRFFGPDAVALLFIALCWIAAVILVNPVGEFPSVDDWSYRSAVQALVERGEIKFSDWTGVNLLSQVFWGALFALPFGASYTTLRISTLVAALLAAFALYRLIRDADRPISLALFAALALLFNPIFFALSFTFMTDVPFVAMQTGAMLFLMAGLSTGSRVASALGWFLAVVALLCRQAAFVIPIAYGGAYLVKNGGLGARRLTVAILPLLAFFGLQWGYEFWLSATGKTPALYGMVAIVTWPIGTVAAQLYEVARYIFFYMGFFLLPVSLPVTATIILTLPRRIAVALVACGLALIAGLVVVSLHSGLVMPIWPHTWRHTGIGADSAGIRAPLLFFQLVTVLSVTGGVLLVTSLCYAGYRALRGSSGTAWRFVFGLLGAGATAGLLGILLWKYDRYLLPILPWLAFVVVFAMPSSETNAPRWSLLVSSVLLAGMAWYSTVNEHNHMVERRVRTEALADLVAQGVPRDTIDASWVFNGETLYDRFGVKPASRDELDNRTALRIISSKKWYSSRDYVVGMKPEPDYQLLRRYPVARWSLWGSSGVDVYVHGPKANPK